MNYQEAIIIIKCNFPPSDRTVLCEALNLAIKVLKEKILIEENIELMLNKE